jgi:enterobactin synthetase component D
MSIQSLPELESFSRPWAGVGVSLGAHPDPEELSRKCGVTLPSSLVNAATARKLEYLAGRHCARQALLRAGYTGAAELAIGEDRAPVWPAGWVGSITHKAGLAWAAAASSDRLRSIGIDTEPVMTEATWRRVERAVVTEREQALEARKALGDALFVTTVFAAKESLYKCLHPLVKRFFGFHDAQITELDLAKGVFRIELLTDLSAEFARGWNIPGRVRSGSEAIQTLVALEKH